MKNLKNTIKIACILTFTLGFTLANAQQKISLDQAIELGYQNNLNLKTRVLKVDYHEKMKKSYATIDPLGIEGELGQFNSEKTDNRISISQNLRLPGFYKKQKQVLLEEWKNANLGVEIQKLALKKEISLVYNELNYQDEKRKLLEKTDSLYAQYYKKATLRLKKGESNILEKTTAENYRAQAKIQLDNLLEDQKYTLSMFNYLIQDKENYINENQNFYRADLFSSDENFSGNPLLIQQLEQEKNIESAKLGSERAKLSPVFNVGINSMTIAGTGSNDSKRFQSGVLGVSIPIFNSAQKSVIEAQKINQKIAENRYSLGLKNMEIQYSKLKNEFQKLKNEQNYYKTQGLENAKTILKTADRLFYEGEINYLEWSILVNQSLEIQNKYIDNQKNINEKIIELNSLKGL